MNFRELAGLQLGQYYLIDLIGEGGMSAVYRAYQENLDREVAVKVLSEERLRESGNIKRFAQEARTAASLEHANIIPVHDYGTQDGVSYVIMRLLPGGSLSDRLRYARKYNKPLPSVQEAAEFLQKIAEALGYAHSRGVIHRDIKSSNIMFNLRGNPFIVDFGIAQLIHSDATEDGDTLIGTPTYMAPEQWNNEPLTPAVDQYALGILMYQLLTGRLPFDAKSPVALMDMHLHRMPEEVHKIRDTLPENLSPIIDRAMAKDPRDRFRAVERFSEIFSAAVAGRSDRPSNFFVMRLPNSVAAVASRGAKGRANSMKSRSSTSYNIHQLKTRRSVSALPLPQEKAALAPEEKVPVEAPVMASVVADVGGAAAEEARIEKRRRNSMVIFVGSVMLVVFGFLLVVIASGLLPDLSAAEESPVLSTASRESAISIITDPTYTPTPVSARDPTPRATQLRDAVPTATLLPAETLSELENRQSPAMTARAISVIGATSSPERSASATEETQGLLTIPRSTHLSETPSPPLEQLADDHEENRSVLTIPQKNAPVLRELRVAPPGELRPLRALHSQAQTPVRAVGFGNRGVLASAHGDGAIRLWRNLEDPPDILMGHEGIVYSLAFSPDGRLIASAGDDATVRIWDAQTGSLEKVLSGHRNKARDVAFNSDGSLVASASEDTTVRVWRVESGDELSVLRTPGSRALTVVFSPDGRVLVSANEDGRIYFWDVETGEQLQSLLAHVESIRKVVFSPDGRWLATSSTDNTIRVWLAETNKLVYTFTAHERDVWYATFSPDSRYLASGGRDNNIRLWDMASGVEVATLSEHTGWVFGLAYAQDGSRLVSASGDGTVLLWGIPES